MMKRFVVLLLFGWPLAAAVPSNGEALHYTISWPSGLSLGEGEMKVARNGENWSFEFQFEAALPGFAVADRFVSLTGLNRCSVRFDKDLRHGARKSQEKITFDASSGKATRQTVGGGKSEMDVPACAHDALSYLFHLRHELAQGRIPAAENVYYGAPYRVRLEYKGSQKIKVGEAMEDADRVLAFVKGPSSELQLELFFGKDAARTPLAAKVPVAVGTFTVELVR
ncbi:MAG: DUF3108 domain-containing protein [Bryobacterales bacterium]|nr:DUF3108 domain-containing protein [Bryobacterales bacterium]